MDLGPWQLRAAGLLCREAPAEADAGGEGGLQGRADRALPGSAGRDLVQLLRGRRMLNSVRDLADLPWEMAGPHVDSDEEELLFRGIVERGLKSVGE